MKVSSVPPAVRKFIEKRLQSAEPPCDGFWLTYVNDGSPLRNVNVPQGGHIERIAKAIFDELAEAAVDHAATSDGMHRFSVEAKGPSPERRSIGSHLFALTTTGAGTTTTWETVDVGSNEPLEALLRDELLGPSSSKRELLPSNGHFADIARLYEAMQKSSNSHLPAATMKVALDYAHNTGKVLVEAMPRLMLVQNDMIKFLMDNAKEQREMDIKTREMMADLVTKREERQANLRMELRKEKRAARRMDKVERVLEAILPGLIENFTGESAVLQLIKEVPEPELRMIMGHLSPKARKLIQAILARAKAREEKIRYRPPTTKKGNRNARTP